MSEDRWPMGIVIKRWFPQKNKASNTKVNLPVTNGAAFAKNSAFSTLNRSCSNENSRATSSLFSNFKSSFVNKVTHTKECDFLSVAKEGNYDLHKTDNFKIDIRDFNFHKTLNIPR